MAGANGLELRSKADWRLWCDTEYAAGAEYFESLLTTWLLRLREEFALAVSTWAFVTSPQLRARAHT